MKRANVSLLFAAAALSLLCGCVPLQMAEATLRESNLADVVMDSAFSQTPSENGGLVQSIAATTGSAELVQRSYTAQGEIRKLDVEADNVSIKIQSAEIERAVVEYNEPADRTLYTISERNGELKVENRRDSRSLRSEEEFTLTVTLPAAEYESIEAGADNGSIDLQGLSAWEIEADVDNGSVSAGSITANKLSLDADNGQVKLTGSSIGLLEAGVDNGEILFSQADAKAYDCEVDNGKITGTLVGSESDYSIRSSVRLGNNNLPSALRSGAARSIEFEVEIGDIDIQFEG